jgi:hypothetical protein
MARPAPKAKSHRPKSQALPGMEDRAIKALEDVAHDYADIRYRRMGLTSEESRLKQRALTLMHQHQRSRYKRNGIEIRVVPGEEKLAVKFVKEKTDDEDDVDLAAGTELRPGVTAE